MEAFTEWLVAYGMGPLLGALVVGLAPPIRKLVKRSFIGLIRVFQTPGRVDEIDEWRSRHEEVHL